MTLFAPLRRLALTALLGACACGPLAAKTPGEVEVGQVLREAQMQGLNGPSAKLLSFKGRPLIINVWASWCGPCRSEMASLERLAWWDEAGRFTIIGISTDDYVDKAKAALNPEKTTIRHFIDKQLELENMLGASRLPLTLLVDANGKVLDKIVGAREWDSPESLALIRKTFWPAGAKPPRKGG
jgi:thiol-disulfide isomerase/thioredoxin